MSSCEAGPRILKVEGRGEREVEGPGTGQLGCKDVNMSICKSAGAWPIIGSGSSLDSSFIICVIYGKKFSELNSFICKMSILRLTMPMSAVNTEIIDPTSLIIRFIMGSN